MPHSTGPRRKRCFVLLFECHGGRGGAGRPRSPRRHCPPQCTTSAHALQLHNDYVDLKPDGMTKKKIMMAKLLVKNFDRFGHTITLQRRRGALPKVVQGGGLIGVGPYFANFFAKFRPFFDVARCCEAQAAAVPHVLSTTSNCPGRLDTVVRLWVVVVNHSV